jgi:hypothetical protein
MYGPSEEREGQFLGSMMCFIFLCISVEKDVWCLKVALCMCQCVNLPHSPVF